MARLALYQCFAAESVISQSESFLNPLNSDYEESIDKLKPNRRGYIGNWY